MVLSGRFIGGAVGQLLRDVPDDRLGAAIGGIESAAAEIRAAGLNANRSAKPIAQTMKR